MHVNGYLGPNILNRLSGAPAEELEPVKLAEYERFARTGDWYEALFAITRRLLLTPTPRSLQREHDLWTYGPRFNLDKRFYLEVKEDKAERVFLEYEVPVYVQALDSMDNNRPIVEFHIHPQHALENISPLEEEKKLRVIEPEEAMGLSIDFQAALTKFETGM